MGRKLLVDLLRDLRLKRQQPEAEADLIIHLRAIVRLENIHQSESRVKESSITTDHEVSNPLRIPGISQTACRTSCRGKMFSRHCTATSRLF